MKIRVSKKTYQTLTRIARILDGIVMIISTVIVLASVLLTCHTLSITLEASGYSASVAQAYEDAKAFHPAHRQEYIDEVYLEVQESREALYYENEYNEWFFLELNKFFRFIIITIQIIFSVCAVWMWYDAYFPKKS